MIRLLLTAVALAAAAPAAEAQTHTWRQALDAIRQVETGGLPNEGAGAKGDNGRAAGPYQIHSIYHTDAAERDKSLVSYARCLNSKSYSERVVFAYMGRYARACRDRLQRGVGTLADIERIARIHNGGPRGHKKKATLGYWAKVKKALKTGKPR